jgi:DNA-binding transcriptional MerR regulator
VPQLSLFDQQPVPVVLSVPKVDTTKLTKVYYTITEVAAMFNVNSSLLRFWEKEFPTQLGKVKKNKKGDRYYNLEDIEKLKMIFYIVKEKRMTLEGARNFLKNNKRKVKDDRTMLKSLEKVKRFLVELKGNLA